MKYCKELLLNQQQEYGLLHINVILIISKKY